MFLDHEDDTSLLAKLGLEEDSIGRFRGVIEVKANEVYEDMSWDFPTIIITTRTGGGNRKGHMEDNARLAKHPNYIGDFDDEYDSTYADFVFRHPDINFIGK